MTHPFSPAMIEKYVLKVTQELKLQPRQVAATAMLLEEGATVPFIARYRKERTGELDEVQITSIRDRLEQLEELDKRRESIVSSLEERKLLTEELKAKIDGAETLATLEDIYLPFRPKKRTKATVAKERGLEPLADIIWAQDVSTDPVAEAAPFVDAAKEVPDAEAALAGARDIIAERINDDAEVRAKLRDLYLTKGVLKSKVALGKEEEGPSSRTTSTGANPLLRRLRTAFWPFAAVSPRVPVFPSHSAGGGSAHHRGKSLRARQIARCRAGAPCRPGLLQASPRLCDGGRGPYFLQEEGRRGSHSRFRREPARAAARFAPGPEDDARHRPGFRTGCKVVVLDRQGKLLENEVIYPEKSTREQVEAAEVLHSLVKKHHIEAIAIGNGTASRETEAFIRKIKLPTSIPVVVVNESGASIYSASEVAREEFPNHDITVRGAVSIGRRLMDPLAELVKIDPKSIGVGQYQHDVDQNALKRSLDDIVISCVNNVGVELNTASKHLLSYVSGLNSRTAASIVEHRDANGPFKSRKELLKVANLGPKAFEQAAGFLRIRDGEDPLDASAVHPERYDLVNSIARDIGATVSELLKDGVKRNKIDLKKYVTEDVGLPTLNDIMQELAKPGRDPRQQFEAFSFADGVEKLEQLQPGMKLPGIVTNVTAFGAFVDIGVHQDGLVHISQLSDQFVKNPADVVKVGQKVHVTVMEVDLARKRVGLSMKSKPEAAPARKPGEKRSEGNSRDVDRHRSGNRGGGGGGGFGQVDWFTAAMNKKH